MQGTDSSRGTYISKYETKCLIICNKKKNKFIKLKKRHPLCHYCDNSFATGPLFIKTEMILGKFFF